MRTRLSAPYVNSIIRFPFPFPDSSPSALSLNSMMQCYQVKAPHITHFELPFQIWITTSLLLLQTYVSYVPQDSSSSSYATFWWLARTLRSGILPDWIFPPIWAFIVIVHSAEGVYVATLARKHHMPWHIAVSSPHCASARRSRAH